MELSAELRSKERKARREAFLLGAAGIVAMIVGLWAIQSKNLPPSLVWVITLVIFGPVMVFIAIIGYYSYLETVEEDRYLPHTSH